MPSYKIILIYGFAVFSMFFGSGNLVFPLKIGQMSGPYWFLGFLGLFMSGIILPFLGLFVVKFHRGSYDSFFKEAGPFAKHFLPFFTLSLLGSFGVVPRCITVAYGGVGSLAPYLPLGIFSVLFCMVMFFLCLRDQRMMNALGKWMSPLLLISLTILILMAVFKAPLLPPSQIQPKESFWGGFLTGYQTMDLFAAFFFSSLVFGHIQKIMPKDTTLKETIRFALKPSLIGALFLALVYLGFVYLGAYFSETIKDAEPEFMLATIAYHVLGDNATLFIGIAMLFSCLTTAIALNTIYARYLCSLFHFDQARFKHLLLVTTVVSCAISFFDFRGIAGFLAPVLEVSYPSIIGLTILCIITPNYPLIKKLCFYGLLFFMVLNEFFGLF